MGTQLIGSNVDAGSNLIVNALTPRAWNFAVTANGVADTLYFKANNSTTYKFGVYSLSSISGTPTTLLATTGDIIATAGSIYSIALSTPITMSVGQFYALAAKPLAAGSIRGAASPTANQRNSGTDATYADPFDPTWSNTGGATSSTPVIWLESTVTNITAIDELESGSTSTLTLNNAGFAATNVKITSDTITKNVSTSGTATTFTFPCPSWVDGATALKYGACSVVANDGAVDTTAFTSVPLTLPPPYAAVVLTSVSADSIDKIAGISPAYTVSTQVVYRSDHGTVYPNGTWDSMIFDGEYWVDSGYTGETYLAHRDPTDKIARVGVISIEGGVPAPSDSGLTASGLTHRGFAVSGLTHRGL